MLRSSTISRLAGAAAAIWMYGAGAAWAGTGGSGIPLQPVLDGVCMAFVPGAITTPSWCPQLAAATHQVLAIAGLTNQTPDAVRVENFACTPPGCPQVSINAVNGPAKSPPDDSSALPFLTPLPFLPPPTSCAPTPCTPLGVPTQVGDPAAVASFSAVVLEDADGQPKTLDVFVETKNPGATGRVTLSLPLVVLHKDGSELPVAATLKATCQGGNQGGNQPCQSATVSGDFLGTGKNMTYSANQLGLSFSFNSGLVEVRIPLVATMLNDPPYFNTPPTSQCPNGINPITGYCDAFSQEDLGFFASFLKGGSMGIAPIAGPLLPACATSSPPTCSPPPATFAFCASFSNNKPAIAAFAYIGTDATTYVSSPVPGMGVTLPQCPTQN